MDKGCYYCDAIGFEKVDFDSSQCAGMEGMRALFVSPHHKPVEIRIPDGLKPMQRAIEGMIEIVAPFEDRSALLVCNEEAKLIGMEGNRRLENDVIAGPFFLVCDDGEGGTTDLTDDQVARFTRRFAESEEISKEEIEDHTGFTFIPL